MNTALPPRRPPSSLGRRLSLLGVSLTVMWLAACASLPPPVDHPATHAFEQPRSTSLGRMVEGQSPNPRLSGFRLLVSGEDAFGGLATLADRAEKTLDLQYYIVENDASSRALMLRVRAAANRGVRVRILVDDMNTVGEDEPMLRLNAVPNIEVRVYNPFVTGRNSLAMRFITSLTDIDRINRRMHNKMMVADNAMAITGGRNLGDAYFLHSHVSNFVDIDTVAVGPVVGMLSASFDSFWNNSLAYSIASIASAAARRDASAPTGTANPDGLPPSVPDADRQVLEANARPPERAPDFDIPADNPLASELRDGTLKLVWAPATVIADHPSKIAEMVDETDPTRLRSQDTVIDNVGSLIAQSQSSLILISPYFVPGERGMALLSDVTGRGVKVGVLTNSLATTDAPAVHIGYARYREPLLTMGVDIFELKPKLGQRNTSLGSFGSSQASLHAKSLVIDDNTVVVGSMNLDPRSANLNTEIGIVIRSRELARQLTDLYQGVGRDSSWRLATDAAHQLTWTSSPVGGPTVVATDEPEASSGRKLLLKLLSPFAPESML
ncbi:MAG: cardiolipin synthetase [Rhizobacter sp.]|nr:cardiolipin synthetase [Rhizobacter sp.]